MVMGNLAHHLGVGLNTGGLPCPCRLFVRYVVAMVVGLLNGSVEIVDPRKLKASRDSRHLGWRAG